jgi:hypothetical protein
LLPLWPTLSPPRLLPWPLPNLFAFNCVLICISICKLTIDTYGFVATTYDFVVCECVFAYD